MSTHRPNRGHGSVSRRAILLGLLGGAAGLAVGNDRLLATEEPALAETTLQLTAEDVTIHATCGRVSDVSVSGDSAADLEYENIPSTIADEFELTLEANPHVADRENHEGWSEPNDSSGAIVPQEDLDGDGTDADPYTITTDQELQAIAEELDAHYELGTNIDASMTDQWNDGAGFDPIGSQDEPFTGSFDGNGYEICGITIDRSDERRVGVFGFIDGVLENVFVTNVDITGLGEVGALVGGTGADDMDDSIVSGVHARGTVTGQFTVGGLVGYNHDDRPVEDSSVAVDVDTEEFDTDEGEEFVGGLVGYNSGDVIDSHATGTVAGPNDVGGLVGLNFANGQVIDSYGTGEATADHTVGGLVGLNEGDVSDSHAEGDVTAEAVHPDDEYSAAGGLVGYNSGAADVGTVTGSYVTGDATIGGESVVGGLVGLNFEGDEEDDTVGTITDSHVTADVTVEGFDDDESAAGGLVGANGDGSVITASSAECAVSGHQFVGGLVGSNLAEGTGLLGLGGDSPGVIRESFASGPVEGGDNVGGLVGSNGGLVEDAYARGDVAGGEWVGGFVGINLSEGSFLGLIGGDEEGEIYRAYATGDVTGDDTVGGYAGENESGGLGESDAVLEDAYWDTESTGQDDGIGDGVGEDELEGLTTDEMQGSVAETTMDALDFHDPEIWTTVENPDDYPELVNTEFSGPSDVTDDYGQLEESGDPAGFDAIFESEPIDELPGDLPHDEVTASLSSLVGEDVPFALENHDAIDGGADDGTAYREFEPYRAVERKTKVDFKLVLEHVDEDLESTAETAESATVHVSGETDE